MEIQKLRLKHGWSQQQLADASGLSVRTVQRLEGGHTASLETTKCLAAVFGVDIETVQPGAVMTESTDPKPLSPPTPSLLDAAARDAFAHVKRIRKFWIHVLQYVVPQGLGQSISWWTQNTFGSSAFQYSGQSGWPCTEFTYLLSPIFLAAIGSAAWSSVE